MKYPKSLVLLFISILFISSCINAVDVSQCIETKSSGFWLGLWHGFICPFSFIGSLFDPQIAIYDVNNNGNFYNLGYVLGVASFFGGGTKAGKRKK